jgi:hypothetical protein
MAVAASVKEIKEKYQPFSISARWDVETHLWKVSAQKHERGDVHELAVDAKLSTAFREAAAKPVGDSWTADEGEK